MHEYTIKLIKRKLHKDDTIMYASEIIKEESYKFTIKNDKGVLNKLKKELKEIVKGFKEYE